MAGSSREYQIIEPVVQRWVGRRASRLCAGAGWPGASVALRSRRAVRRSYGFDADAMVARSTLACRSSARYLRRGGNRIVLFDHLGGTDEQRGRHGEAERFGRLQVDH